MASNKQSAPKGRGRPRLDEEESTVPITLRMTTTQREKLAKLGGPPWVRERIDKAKLPKQ